MTRIKRHFKREKWRQNIVYNSNELLNDRNIFRMELIYLDIHRNLIRNHQER